MNAYLLFKSIHLIAVISWMAGLLYLPRIFVYHAETKNNLGKDETFKIMERRLMIYIMNPAMIASWIFGLLLLYSTGLESADYLWFKLKFILIIILTIFHFFLFYCMKNFSSNLNSYSPKFYRFINEIPTILLIVVVFLVVFKPL